ncbi:MRPL2 isoform 9 [Pongo abelii]|uniref:MRPL2 isoform 9 n=1 Tax=Pongo abelii TaxID=9601 RepID=A0A2J8Y4H8_PONAB|nr:MRPL2 isoform 9 [Pongo abelii]
MALWALTRALRSLSLAPPTVAAPAPSLFPAAQVIHLTREEGCFHSGCRRWGLRGCEAGVASLVRSYADDEQWPPPTALCLDVAPLPPNPYFCGP